MLTIDLNCDMGESFGAYSTGNDDDVVRFVSSANIACGAHASDPHVMGKTVGLCREHGVMVGAHPGYPDLAGFGRRYMDMADGDIIDSVLYQVGALSGFAALHDMPLQHVKLHGALYHYTHRREDLFLDIALAVQRAFGDLIFVALGTLRSKALKERCQSEGVRIAFEAFPDRAYTDDGTLAPRGKPGSVIGNAEEIARRAIMMVRDRSVTGTGGKRVDLIIDTLCIHGDNGPSIAAAPLIREYAAAEGIAVAPMSTFL